MLRQKLIALIFLLSIVTVTLADEGEKHSCKQGEFLENGKCFPCSSSMRGCKECIAKYKCISCGDNYALVEDLCTHALE